MKTLFQLNLLFLLVYTSALGQINIKDYEGSWKGKLNNQNFSFDILIELNPNNTLYVQLTQNQRILLERKARCIPEQIIEIHLGDFQVLKLMISKDQLITSAFIQSGLLQYHLPFQYDGRAYKGVWNPWFTDQINPGITYLNIENSDDGVMAFPFFDDLRFPGTFATNFQHNENELSFVDFMTGVSFVARLMDDAIDLKLSVAGISFTEASLKRYEGNFPVGHSYKPMINKDMLGISSSITESKEELGQIDAIIVSKKSNIILEAYYNGFSSKIPHQLRSAQKSLTSALTGIAIDQGRIPNHQVKLFDYVDGKYLSAATDKKLDITLEHLLTMSSGIDAIDFGAKDRSAAAEDNYQRTGDWTETILNAKMINTPGTVANYGSANPHLIGLILDKAISEPLIFYNDQFLMKPLGIVDYVIQNDISNKMYFAGGMYLKPMDMLKFGQLYLDKGRFAGHQILSEEWVDASFSAHNRLDNDLDQSEYGYLWWKKIYEVKEKKIQSYEARGAGGQYIMIVPELDLVVAITSSNFRNAKFKSPELILEKYILPKVM